MKLARVCLGAGLAAALAGCATTCPEAQIANQTEARYACANGVSLNVTFDRAAGRALVSEDGGAALDLPIQISGSGFRYADEGVELRGRGRDVQWTSQAGETVTCQGVD
ncbi:MAG: MliC family protein [Hyphomonadaceae bacterium]